MRDSARKGESFADEIVNTGERACYTRSDMQFDRRAYLSAIPHCRNRYADYYLSPAIYWQLNGRQHFRGAPADTQ